MCLYLKYCPRDNDKCGTGSFALPPSKWIHKGHIVILMFSALDTTDDAALHSFGFFPHILSVDIRMFFFISEIGF